MPLLILYDGVCGLCQRLNTFVLPRDRDNRFLFAALQGETARHIVAKHGRDPDVLETLYLVEHFREPTEHLLSKSRAAFAVLRALGWPWSIVSICRFLPRFFTDAVYDQIAKRRYRLFGKHDTCLLPTPAYRDKFID